MEESLRIAMCSDFFYPQLGGVEMHIWSLAQCLLRRGHKVIVLTHSVNRPASSNKQHRPQQRVGIRYMTHGLKVYYLPMTLMVDNVTYPTFVNQLSLLRSILIRERIQIVHGHQATSNLMHECLVQAKALSTPHQPLHTVYTDHSLFGFADSASVHLNKVLKFSLSTVDHAIAVSHTCKENLVLRASLAPEKISTIPNAVDATKFLPSPSPPSSDTINVVIISRLVYRKGIDLVGPAIQIVCAKTSNVNFIIGGDGPKRLQLEEVRDKCRLHDRVQLIGAVPHSQVRQVLSQGHIFLNSSITESFCIAILEAAACGLFVVTTKVGGVPEVLPPDMVQFASDITSEALAEAILEALPKVPHVDRQAFHRRVEDMYDWRKVAQRTEVVYRKVVARHPPSLLERLQLYYGVGPIAGLFACVIVAVLQMYVSWLAIWKPAKEIEIALDWPRKEVKSDSSDERTDEEGLTDSRIESVDEA